MPSGPSESCHDRRESPVVGRLVRMTPRQPASLDSPLHARQYTRYGGRPAGTQAHGCTRMHGERPSLRACGSRACGSRACRRRAAGTRLQAIAPESEDYISFQSGTLAIATIQPTRPPAGGGLSAIAVSERPANPGVRWHAGPGHPLIVPPPVQHAATRAVPPCRGVDSPVLQLLDRRPLSGVCSGAARSSRRRSGHAHAACCRVLRICAACRPCRRSRASFHAGLPTVFNRPVRLPRGARAASIRPL